MALRQISRGVDCSKMSISALNWKVVIIRPEHYPVARTEIEPRVFIRATDNYLELAARFVVPVRQARWSNDAYTRRVLDRLRSDDIPVASATSEVTVRPFKSSVALAPAEHAPD